jgi:hypothetical protein
MRIMRLTRTRFSLSFVDSGRASSRKKKAGTLDERPGAHDESNDGQ